MGKIEARKGPGPGRVWRKTSILLEHICSQLPRETYSVYEKNRFLEDLVVNSMQGVHCECWLKEE